MPSHPLLREVVESSKELQGQERAGVGFGGKGSSAVTAQGITAPLPGQDLLLSQARNSPSPRAPLSAQ